MEKLILYFNPTAPLPLIVLTSYSSERGVQQEHSFIIYLQRMEPALYIIMGS